MYSGQFFRVRCIVRHVVEGRKVGRHVFSSRSLLLSTIVLNDVDPDIENEPLSNLSWK